MRAIALVLTIVCASVAEARPALDYLNWRRQAVGLQPYRYDPTLQAAAERSARQQANRGRMGHCQHIGSRSGVGMTTDSRGPRTFRTCYAFDRGTAYAGAAACQGRNGTWFFALDLRNAPSSRAGACPKCGGWH